MTVRVHIERLVLDGLPLDRRQAARVQAALELELGRLLAMPDAWSSVAGGAIPALRATPIACQGHERPEALGERLGQAVYGSVQS